MSSEQWSRAFLHRLAKPAVALCATLLALLAAEAIVRVFRLAPGIKPIQFSSCDCIYKRSTNPILGFELKANCHSDDPDVVVLVFVENDFDNFNREVFPLEGTIDRLAVIKALFRRSHFFRLASIRLNLFHFGAEANPVRWNQDAIGDNNVAEGLYRLRQLADRHGFQLLIIIWLRFQDDRIADVCFMPQSSEQFVVEHLAAMHDIPSVGLSEFFR